MSQDYETKRSDLRASRDEPTDGRPAAEDPLVELARIVHKNKQSGANVSSGRVGSTDYFAGLEEVAADTASTAQPETGRQEPTFTPVTPVAPPVTETVFQDQSEAVSPAAQDIAAASGAPEPKQSFDPFDQIVAAPQRSDAGQSSHVSSLWPEIETAEDVSQASEASVVSKRSEFQVQTPIEETSVRVEPREQQAANDQPGLAPNLSINLEENLTAELEDELIGALRQSVDETQPVSPTQDPTPEPNTVSETLGRSLEADLEGYGAQSGINEAGNETPPTGSYQTDAALAPAGIPKTYSVQDPSEPAFRQASAESADVRDVGTRTEAPVLRAAPQRDTPDFGQSDARQDDTSRPRIDENDLFAALNPAAPATETQQQAASQETGGDPAGIDALFADLDFPPPVDRGNSASIEEASSPAQSAAEPNIDDMSWPAAAAEVPQSEEDETLPPPEGYDLDAVARAMQESDPSLTGAGVLPPHSSAEQDAVPQAREKSRRGLFVAAGVMGIAVLGAAGFFLVDTDGVVVPNGPPPVISGLQEPLKIYPEESQALADNQSAKQIYDRINDNNDTAQSNLLLPDTPQPAELPPAPAAANGGADLVPGAPKRVRTVIVRPDGTIVAENEPTPPSATAPAPAVTPAAAPVPAPAASPAPAESTNSDASRVVSTTPVAVTPEPAAPVAAPEPAALAPAVAETPAIVVGSSEPAAAPTETQPSSEIVSVLPRKKPDAPVQVASAPPAAATPAPVAQNSGPLNLNQSASASAATPAPTGTTGSIPSGTYIVQVTSQRSAAAASDAYSGLQRRFPAILGNRNAVIVSANVQDRGVFYRARIPTTTREEAISLCESLQSAGGDCFVRRQP